MASSPYEPRGVIPACLLPFDDDLQIDEAAYRKHLRDVTAARGLSAITVNAHSTEVSSCSSAEQERVLDLTLAEVGDRIPVVNGVFAEGSIEAARLARAAERGGASALLVFTPALFSIGAQVKPDMVLTHYRYIAEATDLPLILFQFPMSTGQGFSLETMLRLVEEIPSIRATKDFSNDPVLLERTVRALQGLPRPVRVLSTHSAWLLPSLIGGAEGILSGSGSTIPELQVALFEAVQRGDLTAARAAADRIYPISEAFYRSPFLDMHNRMKAAQVLLGRLPKANVRPPLIKVDAAEVERLEQALRDSGLLDVARHAAA
jgi:4-hydroxy-tetrahydrodipicolinate synthase